MAKKNIVFPNGFTSFCDVHCDISIALAEHIEKQDDNKAFKEHEKHGRIALHEMALSLAIKFEKEYENTAWEGNYRDALDDFLLAELYFTM